MTHLVLWWCLLIEVHSEKDGLHVVEENVDGNDLCDDDFYDFEEYDIEAGDLKRMMMERIFMILKRIITFLSPISQSSCSL